MNDTTTTVEAVEAEDAGKTASDASAENEAKAPAKPKKARKAKVNDKPSEAEISEDIQAANKLAEEAEEAEQGDEPQDDESEPEKAIRVASETMLGDLRDICMQNIRFNIEWSKLPEAKQRDIVSNVETAVSYAIGKAVKHIANAGHDEVIGTIESVTVKDGIKTVIKSKMDHESILALANAQGNFVRILVTDSEQFKGTHDDYPVEPDQPELID